MQGWNLFWINRLSIYGIQYHRILIPASGFYEWNQLKEKNTFTRSDSTVMYLAGFCDWFENERRFVILTTVANESMKFALPCSDLP